VDDFGSLFELHVTRCIIRILLYLFFGQLTSSSHFLSSRFFCRSFYLLLCFPAVWRPWRTGFVNLRDISLLIIQTSSVLCLGVSCNSFFFDTLCFPFTVNKLSMPIYKYISNAVFMFVSAELESRLLVSYECMHNNRITTLSTCSICSEEQIAKRPKMDFRKC